ncbi:DUF1493 family protein (plasmid) [Serratia marcescens]|nr:DUF1493 family protein [Serratia marcescens]QDI55059.1 DUF1493 family protein [Serratia marcescens]
MVTETLEEQVIALVRKHYGSIISGRAPVITPGSDIDADIGMDWAEAEGLMEDFLKSSQSIRPVSISKPITPIRRWGHCSKICSGVKRTSRSTPFTVNMLIESAKSGRWLF